MQLACAAGAAASAVACAEAALHRRDMCCCSPFSPSSTSAEGSCKLPGWRLPLQQHITTAVNHSSAAVKAATNAAWCSELLHHHSTLQDTAVAAAAQAYLCCPASSRFSVLHCCYAARVVVAARCHTLLPTCSAGLQACPTCQHSSKSWRVFPLLGLQLEQQIHLILCWCAC